MKWIFRIGLLCLLLLLMAMGIYVVLQPGYFRCLNISRENMTMIAPRVYVTPQMPATMRDSLLYYLKQAQQRIIGFFGSQQANPIIIAGHDLWAIRYFGAVQARTGMTHLAPTGAYIVLAPEGINADVLAHELCHAELMARVGWWNRTFQVPAWFDEGLAMLLDNRFPNAETEWQAITQNGQYAPPLAELTTNRSFFSNPHHLYLNYLTARHEVEQWYSVHRQRGLQLLCKCLADGHSFHQCYKRPHH
ncbi:MAG: hypothetical protein NZM34_08595 [Bernardetiaceae bacterium]|nr:hypothetical protein [Bernardetiaceae bacterium]